MRTPLLAPWFLPSLLAAQGLPISKLEVRELTAFKDGHAFVLRAGDATPGADGRVVLDELPTPVLGTFWPGVTGKDATLRSVTASHHRVVFDRTALDLRQLILANVGADVVVRETGDIRYPARILGLPARAPAEIEARSAPGSEPPLTERGDWLLLQTDVARKDTSAERVADTGTRLVRLDRIVDLTFLREPKGTFTDEELRRQLLLDVTFQGQKPATVPVAITWLEKGFRWIPQYRLVIDGKGQAAVKLQATLVNDLVDLEQSTVHLVVGVPSFVFADQVDPIALSGTAAALASRLPSSPTQLLLNTAVMSQVAGNPVAPGHNAETSDTGPEVAGSRKEEDLFVFTLQGITLKRRERMVVTVAEFPVSYRDVWKLDVSVAPPPEAWEHLRNQGELARLMAAPKVQHKLRLSNAGPAPFTTAPALVLLGERVLAQGMMTYTPAGQTCDVALTTAVDILVKKSDKETGRTPNAVRWNDYTYTRVDLEGTLHLENRRAQPVEVEVVRHVLGKLTSASTGGILEQVNPHEDTSCLPEGLGSRWAPWWLDRNGVGRATWTVKLEPGQEARVTAAWQYHWR